MYRNPRVFVSAAETEELVRLSRQLQQECSGEQGTQKQQQQQRLLLLNLALVELRERRHSDCLLSAIDKLSASETHNTPEAARTPETTRSSCSSSSSSCCTSSRAPLGAAGSAAAAAQGRLHVDAADGNSHKGNTTRNPESSGKASLFTRAP